MTTVTIEPGEGYYPVPARIDRLEKITVSTNLIVPHWKYTTKVSYLSFDRAEMIDRFFVKECEALLEELHRYAEQNKGNAS